MNCEICCESENKTVHKLIQCPYINCEFLACKKCIRYYLNNSIDDPHCMKCKKEWEDDFIVNNLNRSYYNNEYKENRKKVLLERELSKLVESASEAEAKRKIFKINEVEKRIKHEISFLKDKLIDISLEKEEIEKKGKKGKEFVMACPDKNCRGFLSIDYKCGLCDRFTCETCLVLKENNHVCIQEDIDTAKIIKNDTKPCPNCGERIMKSEGCDQMWCTMCHTTFSWNTGMLDNGMIHNPHFNQWNRENNRNQIRNDFDLHCGGMPELYFLTEKFKVLSKLDVFIDEDKTIAWEDIKIPELLNIVKDSELIRKLNFLKKYCLFDTYDIKKTMINIHKFLRNITHYELPHIRQKVRQLNDNNSERIEFILKNIDKKELANKIFNKDIKRKKMKKEHNLYELTSVCGIDMIAELISEQYTFISNTPVKLDIQHPWYKFLKLCVEKIFEFIQLLNYVNDEFTKICLSSKKNTPRIIWQRYSCGSIQKGYKFLLINTNSCKIDINGKIN